VRESGFTLAEAMVAVGIIIVLVSILLPSLGRVREQARITTCAANEKRIFEAVLAYANENDRYLPCPLFYSPGQNSANIQPNTVNSTSDNGGKYVCWAFKDVGSGPLIGQTDLNVGSLVSYMGSSVPTRQQIVWCPSEVTDKQFRNFSYSFNSAIRPASYAGNGINAYYTLRISDVHNPTQKILLYEERSVLSTTPSELRPDDGEFNMTQVTATKPEYKWAPPAWISGRHGASGEESLPRDVYRDEQWRRKARSNQLFFDGHVELMGVEEFFDPSPTADPTLFRAGPTHFPLK
jgi:prepilin-type processing-associated H-X9-DG protein